MSAKAIESGEGDALGPFLPELLSEGECPWKSSQGWVAQSLGFLNVSSGGLGSGLVLPPGALGPSRLFPVGLSLLPCAVRTPSSPLVLGLPVSGFSLVHLQAPLTPLSSASPEVPSLHQRSWGLQERVEGAVWGLFPSCPPRFVLPHSSFFQRKKNLPSQATRPLMALLLGRHHTGHVRGQVALALTPQIPPSRKAAISTIMQVTGL